MTYKAENHGMSQRNQENVGQWLKFYLSELCYACLHNYRYNLGCNVDDLLATGWDVLSLNRVT